MLRGIDANRIIVGAYVDPRSGGICPMLAAHRNGGRTNVASFARAWDAYTGAKRPRRATRREVRTLRSLLEVSLLATPSRSRASIAELAAQIRAERERMRRPPARGPRSRCGRRRSAGRSPTFPSRQAPRAAIRAARFDRRARRRRRERAEDLLAAAEEQLSGAPQSR